MTPQTSGTKLHEVAYTGETRQGDAQTVTALTSFLWYVIFFNEARQQRESSIVEALSASEAKYAVEFGGDEVLEVYEYSEKWGIIGEY